MAKIYSVGFEINNMDDHIICDSKRCIGRLNERRHTMRSNGERLRQVRERVFPHYNSMQRATNQDVFDLLVAVEQLQNYVNRDLNYKLDAHGMTNVKGERSRMKHHCCCGACDINI